jgi:hypothetical protein
MAQEKTLWQEKVTANSTVYESGRVNIPGTDDFEDVHYVRSGNLSTAPFPKYMFGLKHGI